MMSSVPWHSMDQLFVNWCRLASGLLTVFPQPDGPHTLVKQPLRIDSPILRGQQSRTARQTADRLQSTVVPLVKREREQAS